MAVSLSTFADKNAPWQLAVLDSNFAQIANALNTAGAAGSLFMVDQGTVNALSVQLPSGVTLTPQAGVSISVRCANTTTLAAVTITIVGVQGNNTWQIVNPGGNTNTGLGIGQMVVGGLYELQFDGTYWQIVSSSAQGGAYNGTFQSGPVQVAGPAGVPAGYGDFQFGFLLPNPSGIPSTGVLVGGAGKTQSVIICDAQIPGLKGITRIISAGDAGDATSAGGDLLDFAGGSVGGNGGTRNMQGGTSVNARAGDSVVSGGNATGSAPTAQAGNGVVQSGQVGKIPGNVVLSANIPPGATGISVIRHQSGSAAGTALWMDEYPDGSLFLYDIAGKPTRGGFGLAGQPLVSGGPGNPVSYQVGFTGTFTTNDGRTAHVSSGLITSVA